uniref:RNase H type-1 domain-containing protein n=1 Tax=Cacopsylla melanoneura TaxID=428564 RepID=A0A8D8UIR9_9HEMI
MWCPSHIGIKGNETVDHAAANPTLSLSPLKTCSAQDYNSFINKIIKTRWQNSWNDIPLSNKLKQLKPFVEPWDSSNRNSRIEEVIITRIRIGHTRLTHNHLFTRSPPPICTCGDTLTVKHLLSCPSHAQVRSTLPCSPSPIDNAQSCDSLLSYLKSIHVYNLI